MATDGTDARTCHTPVMLEEVLHSLALRPGDEAVDCTFGGGGYTSELLRTVAPNGRVLALDVDPDAVARGRAREWGKDAARLTIVHANFVDVRTVAIAQGFCAPRGIVADLGWSSLQLAAPNRGFSFSEESPLDMRFDPTSGAPTAADILATASEEELERIIRTYGEEPAARRIAAAVIAKRRQQPITTTGELIELIAGVMRWRGRIHPATRTFQALRIAVNDELRVLDRAIPEMLTLVAPRGRIAIVSFHSLEDRIVKRAFRAASAKGIAKIMTKKPLRPSTAEVERNPRSRSAKLRVIERMTT